MDLQAKVFLYHVVILLLNALIPMIPAVIIYWLFPDTKVGVGGPLAQLSLRASGAFAAYLVTFLLLFPLTQQINDTIGGFLKPVWTVEAQVMAIDREGQPRDPDEVLRELQITLNPGILARAEDGVRLKIPRTDEEWPNVLFEIPSFGAKTIDLNTLLAEAAVDDYKKVVRLAHPILIREYAGAQDPYRGGEPGVSPNPSDPE